MAVPVMNLMKKLNKFIEGSPFFSIEQGHILWFPFMYDVCEPGLYTTTAQYEVALKIAGPKKWFKIIHVPVVS